MKINSLRLQNFRQHQNALIELGEGVTGIIGPNGAGKSTILEAIAWALYGNSAARGNRDSIRFARSQPGTPVRVELDFELAGHRYRVVRQLSAAQVYLDSASAPIANGITATGEFLQRRLGMSRTEFFNTYFTGQKELNVMAALSPVDRGQFLSRVLGYERLRAAQKLARDQRAIISAEASGLKAALPDEHTIARSLADAEERLLRAALHRADAERAHSAASSALADLAPRWEALQRERVRLQELEAELRVVESEEGGYARDAERLDGELRDIDVIREELNALRLATVRLPELQAELQRLEVLAREQGRRTTLLEHERVLREELDRLRERLQVVSDAPRLEQETMAELVARRKDAEELNVQLEERRTAWVRDRQEAATRREELRRTYAELATQRERLASLGAEGPCPTCTRPLGRNFRTVLDDLDGRLETVKVDGRYYAARVEQLDRMPDEVRELEERRKRMTEMLHALERRLARCQAAAQEREQIAAELETKAARLTTLREELAAIPEGYDGVRHRQLKEDVERQTPLADRATGLTARLEREAELRAARAAAAEQLQRIGARRQELQARHAVLAFDPDRFERARQAFERTATDARAAELALVRSRGEEEASREAAEAARRAAAELRQMRERLDDLTRRRRLHEELERAYNDLRTELNFQLRPEISEIASTFLAQLTDGRFSELELDDSYNIVVLEDGVPKPVISGGEEDLANLVLRLAISQMIADRAGQQFSLLILDEVFGSLDEARRGMVMELLRGLQDRFEQVILITHIENVREGLDRVITLRYDEASGTSVVENGRLFDREEEELADQLALPGAGEAA